MPVVTICNLNPIRFRAFKPTDLYNAGQMYGILNEEMEFVDSLTVSNDLKGKEFEFSDEMKSKPFDLHEFQTRAGHQMEDVLRFCKYKGRACEASEFQPVSPKFL